ncbi:MAG: aspartate dehydrogenase [Rhodobacteraceae bacterium]|nr:aspartate dehydrogenase [Paracoccaceae bacterium]
MRLGVIGYGAIARELLSVLAQEGAMPEAVIVLMRERTQANCQMPGLETVGTAGELVAARPDLVIECAGASAVREHVGTCLSGGINTVIASVGALADGGLHDALRGAARGGKSRLILPAGALGGVDLLAALRPSGIEELIYTGRKPPAAWRGSPAEKLVDLDHLDAPVTFFEGDAAQAARDFPKNANVAATLALAGPGFAATRVHLVADPGASCNLHEVSVRAGVGSFHIRIEGKPAPDNPRSSLTTVYSLAREVLNHSREVAI